MKLPSFATLKENYPADMTGDMVLHMIGGRIGLFQQGTNTCVMRMSRAFNYAGVQYELPANAKHPQLLTRTGKDNKNYAYRVQEFLLYLTYKYGPPSIVRNYRPGEKESSVPFMGKTGIIAWSIEGWSDATGHFTLWDGKRGLYEGGHDYFDTFPFTGTDEQGKPKTVRETAARLWAC